MREEVNLNLLVPNSSLIVYNSLVLYVGVMVGNFFSLDIFFRLRRSILVNFQYFSARGGKDIILCLRESSSLTGRRGDTSTV